MKTHPKAIEAIALCKSYGSLQVLKNLNLEVEVGEIFGFLGHNGAGKTSFMKILIGLSYPSSGSVKLFGENIQVKSKKKIGFLPEKVSIPGFLKAIEFLVYCARLSGKSTKEAYLQANELIEKVGLAEFKNEQTTNFSKGMLQKLALAQCMIGEPELLLLDEPGSGLDPLGTVELRNLILEQNQKRKVTIFLNSHRLLEVEKICTRIGILQKGELIALGAISDLTKGKNQIKLRLETWTESLMNLMFQISKEHKFINEQEVVLEPKEIIDTTQIPKLVVENGGNILLYEKSYESLEEIFIRLTGGTK